jgi:hypothetical protein
MENIMNDFQKDLSSTVNKDSEKNEKSLCGRY